MSIKLFPLTGQAYVQIILYMKILSPWPPLWMQNLMLEHVICWWLLMVMSNAYASKL